MNKRETTAKRKPGPRGFKRKYQSIARQLYVEKGLKPDGICKWLEEKFSGIPLPSAKTIERWVTDGKWADDQAFYATSPAQMAKDFRVIAAKWGAEKRRLSAEDPKAFMMINDLGDQMSKITKSLVAIQALEDKRGDMVRFLDGFVPHIRSMNSEQIYYDWFSEMITSYQETLP